MMTSLIGDRRYLLTLLLVLLFATDGSGQSQQQRADSLKVVVAQQRLRIHVADSIGITREAIAARMHLATLVKSKEALGLMNDAAALAWSARLLEDETTVRTELVRAYVNTGDHRRAYEQAMRLVMLGDERLAEQAERSGARTDSLLGDARAAYDRAEHLSGSLIADAEERAARQHAIAQRWMAIAAGLFVVALAVIAFLFMREARRSHAMRMELAALRTEVEALRSAPRNRLREKVPDTSDPEGAAVIGTQGLKAIDVAPPAPDEELMSWFRKRGPERLATFREARARNDHGKIARVVHTLKPQLVAIDAERFAPVCAALIAEDAPSRPDQWNADLDAFEKGLENLLSGSDD
jgi:hypothetical protein